MSTKQVRYDKVLMHLNAVQHELFELQVDFEEDENDHDMSSVEDIRHELSLFIERLNAPEDIFLTTEIKL